MLKNNPIKNNTDNIGFLLIIIKIPDNTDSTEIMYNIL